MFYSPAEHVIVQSMILSKRLLSKPKRFMHSRDRKLTVVYKGDTKTLSDFTLPHLNLARVLRFAKFTSEVVGGGSWLVRPPGVSKLSVRALRN